MITKLSSRRKKAQAALALAVSLWMAGGSLASAQTTTIAEDHNGNVYGNNNGMDWATYTGGSNDNTVIMTGGNVQLGGSNVEVLGAKVTTEEASGNQVTVSGGKITNGSELAGAAAYDVAATLTNNTVTVTGSANIQADIDGAMTANGTADSNHVIIEGGTVNKDSGTGHICGGRSNGGGNATNNTVTISGGTVTARVIVGGSANGGIATGNTVTVSSDVTAGDVFGGYTARGTGAVTGNIVTLNGAKVTGNVYGGYTMNGSGAVTGNSVTLNGAKVTGDVYGGGTQTGTGNLVTGNTLNLSGVNNTVSGKVQNFQTINFENVTWGTPVLTLDGDGVVQNANGTWAAIDASKLKFDNPETIANGKTMNLITGPVGDVTLAAATTALQEYTVAPVTGVLVNAAFQGRLSNAKSALVCTAENKATKLTFGSVEWKDSGALLDHTATLTNVSFDGADVDTSNINFTNIQSLEANKKMTLVSSFGDSVGTITGTKYKVGSTLEGEGKASLVGSDLIFTTEPISKAQEQTHNTVMGATVSMAALSAGNDFVGAATEGLSLASNVGADGVSSFAQMGGGSMRQETGSHVDTHTWNAILALGHQNKKERGAFEYGAFFEYGSGNYSTFSGDERGDGSMHYTGGGLLAKYTTKNSVYVEGSLRAGSVHDDARNVLRDFRGMPYSYETNANYMGFHLGVGKEIAVAGGNAVDVYGKYFYNRRNGVSFDAGGHYDLDAVTSQILRIGARYILKRNKWNFYAGASYEHEFDGKANGTADGVAIRGADTSGASFRGELGATVKPGENSPWNIDLNLSGFAGKKRGFTGGVSVAFMF